MHADFARRKCPVVDGDFVQLAFEIRETVAASAETKTSATGRVRDLSLAGYDRFRRTVEEDLDALAATDKHQLMPHLFLHDRTATQTCPYLVAVVDANEAGGILRRAGDADVVARRTLFAVRAAGEEMGGHG